jgi:hypothetical protein
MKQRGKHFQIVTTMYLLTLIQCRGKTQLLRLLRGELNSLHMRLRSRKRYTRKSRSFFRPAVEMPTRQLRKKFHTSPTQMSIAIERLIWMRWYLKAFDARTSPQPQFGIRSKILFFSATISPKTPSSFAFLVLQETSIILRRERNLGPYRQIPPFDLLAQELLRSKEYGTMIPLPKTLDLNGGSISKRMIKASLK